MIQHIIGLVETKIELAKLEIKSEASHILARALIFITMAILATFVWFFLALGLGLYINGLLHSAYWGIIIISGVHLLFLILIFLFHKQLGLQKGIYLLLDSLFETKDIEHEFKEDE